MKLLELNYKEKNNDLVFALIFIEILVFLFFEVKN